MSVLLLGISHRTAPLSVLEQAAVPDHVRPELLAQTLRSPAVTEALIVSTCNRVEVYAVVEDRHDATSHVTEALARHAGMSTTELTRHSHTRRDDAAVEHLFQVAAGLDSLVVGDEQVLGQVRAAYAASTLHAATGPVLHVLAQHALRVGKRVATETELSRTGTSVVATALQHAGATLPGPGLSGRRAVVLGAGAIGSLAVTQLQRLGAAEVVLVNRTTSRAS